jgi:rhamnogalacturonyl hydrolase YesR
LNAIAAGSRDDASVMNEAFCAKVARSMEDLDRWISRNGWAGYDPYDVKGTRLFMWALSLKKGSRFANTVRKLILGSLILGESLCPRFFRSILRVKPAINAKGMALFAKAYLQLYRSSGEARFKAKALACLGWLDAHRSAGFAYACWGYPFNWRTGVVVPANTPASVVTAAACDAYWTAWQILGESRYLQVCAQTCEFFINHLNIETIDDETVCFSYTPLDHFHVHNTNLLVAELLIRVGGQVGNQTWVETGLKAANYALKEQNEDGSLFYWGRDQNQVNPDRVDHYHAGFEIRCLYSIWKSTGRTEYQVAAERYYRFYLRSLIERGADYAAPKMYPHAVYPIDIHSCAEALLLNSILAADYLEARELIPRIFDWVRERMQERDGHYIFRRTRLLGFELQSRISYMRWGQAWMLLALSEVLQTVNCTRKVSHAE